MARYFQWSEQATLATVQLLAIIHIAFIITPTNTYRFFSNADVACAGNLGSIGNSGCNGLKACYLNNGDIDSESCYDTNMILDPDENLNSYFGACEKNNATVSRLSCHEEGSCFDNRADVAEGSCKGYYACAGNRADVAEGSCQGYYACHQNGGVVGEQSWYVLKYLRACSSIII